MAKKGKSISELTEMFKLMDETESHNNDCENPALGAMGAIGYSGLFFLLTIIVSLF